MSNQPFAAPTELEQAIDPWLQHMRWRRDFVHWRERRINQEAYQNDRLARLEQMTGPINGVRLLDLGAGMGGFAVAAALRGAQVVASEYNSAYCRIIILRAARYHLCLPVINAAGESLPLPAETFDAVVCWDVLEHVQSPEQVLREIARVLRPDGVALITVINRRAWIDPHYHMRGINWMPRPFAEWLIAHRGRSKRGAAFRDMQRLSDMHYFEYRTFTVLAARCGFRVRDFREEELLRGTLFSPKPVRRIARAALRRLGLEHTAYRLQRDWYASMFELGLIRQ